MARQTNILRLAALLQLIGFAVDLVAVLKLTPVSFFLFAFLGVPLILAGIALYIAFVLQTLAKKGAL